MMMRRSRLGRMAGALAVVLLCSLVRPAPSAAAPADEVEGRRHWKRGQALYKKGQYFDAAREFEAGYLATPRPLFLLNIGHAYRRAQALPQARAAYEKLLALEPLYPQRAEIEGYIRSIDDALGVNLEEVARARKKALTAPAPAPPVPSPATALPPPAKPMPPFVQQPISPVDDVPPERRSFYRRPWFWVAAGVVVGGVVAAVLITRGSSCEATTCLAEPR